MSLSNWPAFLTLRVQHGCCWCHIVVLVLKCPLNSVWCCVFMSSVCFQNWHSGQKTVVEKGDPTHQSYNLHSPPLKWICYKKKKSPPDNVFYLRGIFLYFCELNVWPDNCITMEVRLRSAGWQLYCRLCTQWTLNRMILDCSLFCNFYRHTANWALNCSPHWHSHICAFSCIIFYSCLVTRSCRSITKV